MGSPDYIMYKCIQGICSFLMCPFRDLNEKQKNDNNYKTIMASKFINKHRPNCQILTKKEFSSVEPSQTKISLKVLQFQVLVRVGGPQLKCDYFGRAWPEK